MSPLLWALCVCGVTVACLVIIRIIARVAPVGREDENGYHKESA